MADFFAADFFAADFFAADFFAAAFFAVLAFFGAAALRAALPVVLSFMESDMAPKVPPLASIPPTAFVGALLEPLGLFAASFTRF